MACLPFLSSIASSEERSSLLLGAWSKHANSDYNYNETHYLVGYEEYKKDLNGFPLSFNYMFYKNSYRNSTILGGARIKWFNSEYLDFSTNFFVVIGYTRRQLYPLGIAPTFTLGTGKVKLDLVVIPTQVSTLNFRLDI